MRIAWADGLERTPRGLAREMVQPTAWSSSVWITMDGAAYRRYYNPVARSWSAWEAVEVSLNDDRIGLALASGWVSLERAVATAWQHRAPGSRAGIHVSGPLDARHVAWREPEVVEEGEQDGEAWRPLRWSCGLAECDAAYRISSRGRLQSPHTGARTRGFAALGTRWAACRGAGLVDLLAAAGLVCAQVPVAPRVYAAYRALVAGLHPEEHARRQRLRVKRAWDDFNVAAPLVPEVRQRGAGLVARDVWEVLEGLRADAVLGGRLGPLRRVVQRRLGRELGWEELRFVRTCVLQR